MSDGNWNPERIGKSHVEDAARTWPSSGVYLDFRDSTTYDVIIDGKPYPPKAICSKAYELATGTVIRSGQFTGTIDGAWYRRLKELGFEIVQKADYVSPEQTQL